MDHKIRSDRRNLLTGGVEDSTMHLTLLFVFLGRFFSDGTNALACTSAARKISSMAFLGIFAVSTSIRQSRSRVCLPRSAESLCKFPFWKNGNVTICFNCFGAVGKQLASFSWLVFHAVHVRGDPVKNSLIGNTYHFGFPSKVIRNRPGTGLHMEWSQGGGNRLRS